jgi:uncharacterized phage-associated protein
MYKGGQSSMIPYRKEKIINAVAFFAHRHQKKTRQRLYQTSLYKYLAFFDFYSLSETGHPALGLIYKAMKRGPVPVEIYDNKAETATYKFKKDNIGEFIVVKGTPDLDYFSAYELSLLERLIEIFADRWVTSRIMSDASHEEINAWRRTWAEKQNSIINFDLEFDGDVLSKKEDELTYVEEIYLTQKALAS